MTVHYERVALPSMHKSFHGFTNKEEAKKRNGKKYQKMKTRGDRSPRVHELIAPGLLKRIIYQTAAPLTFFPASAPGVIT